MFRGRGGRTCRSRGSASENLPKTSACRRINEIAAASEVRILWSARGRRLYAASLAPHSNSCHGDGPTPLPTVVEVTAQCRDSVELCAPLGARCHGDGVAHAEVTVSQGSSIHLRHPLSPPLRVAGFAGAYCSCGRLKAGSERGRVDS